MVWPWLRAQDGFSMLALVSYSDPNSLLLTGLKLRNKGLAVVLMKPIITRDLPKSQ